MYPVFIFCINRANVHIQPDSIVNRKFVCPSCSWSRDALMGRSIKIMHKFLDDVSALYINLVLIHAGGEATTARSSCN